MPLGENEVDCDGDELFREKLPLPAGLGDGGPYRSSSAEKLSGCPWPGESTSMSESESSPGRGIATAVRRLSSFGSIIGMAMDNRSCATVADCNGRRAAGEGGVTTMVAGGEPGKAVCIARLNVPRGGEGGTMTIGDAGRT